MTMRASSDHHEDHASHAHGPACLSRRHLLIFGGAAVGVVAALPADAFAQNARLVGSTYAAKKVAKLADLSSGKPVEFDYPAKGMSNVLVKLGEKAGGGVGRDADIVAFSAVCTHMGGPVGADSYKPEHKLLGPCPLHLTTFDLTRHGMVASGHATQSLPQVMLEVRGEDVWAVGMMGLVFGYSQNPRA